MSGELLGENADPGHLEGTGHERVVSALHVVLGPRGMDVSAPARFRRPAGVAVGTEEVEWIAFGPDQGHDHVIRFLGDLVAGTVVEFQRESQKALFSSQPESLQEQSEPGVRLHDFDDLLVVHDGSDPRGTAAQRSPAVNLHATVLVQNERRIGVRDRNEGLRTILIQGHDGH